MKGPKYALCRKGKIYAISSYFKLKKLVLAGDIAASEPIFDYELKQWAKVADIGSLYLVIQQFGAEAKNNDKPLALPVIPPDSEWVPPDLHSLRLGSSPELESYLLSTRTQLKKEKDASGKYKSPYEKGGQAEQDFEKAKSLRYNSQSSSLWGRYSYLLIGTGLILAVLLAIFLQTRLRG